MALQGNCIYYEIVDTGETEEVNVTHLIKIYLMT